MSTTLAELDITFIWFKAKNDKDEIEQCSTFIFGNDTSIDECKSQIEYDCHLKCLYEPFDIQLEK